MKTERNEKYLARYFHDGSWWCVDIFASDHDDALAICNKLNLQLDGKLIMTIPCGDPHGGWIANAICAVRNFLWRPRS